MRKNKIRDLKLEEKIRMEAYSWINIIRSCKTWEHYQTVNRAWRRIFWNRWKDRYSYEYVTYYRDMIDDETDELFKRLQEEEKKKSLQEIDNGLNSIEDDIQDA